MTANPPLAVDEGAFKAAMKTFEEYSNARAAIAAMKGGERG